MPLNLSDAPARVRVRRQPVWDNSDPPVQTGWQNVPATYCYVGKARMPDDSVRKFYIAADDMTDAMFESPEGPQGPRVALLCKVDRDGAERMGCFRDDPETNENEALRCGRIIHSALLRKWFDAGILRNPV